MISKAQTGFGVGGGVFNTIVQTQHAAHEIFMHTSGSRTFVEAVTKLLSLDEMTFLGFLVYLLMLLFIWLPLILSLMHAQEKYRLFWTVGAFGSLLISALDLRLLALVIWSTFQGTSSIGDALFRLCMLEPGIAAGIAGYLTLAAAAWAPYAWLRPFET